MISARERRSDTYFRENLHAVLAESAAWRKFKNNDLEFPDPELPNSSSSERTFLDRLRLLALNVLVVAKLEDDETWARGRYARFWCGLANVDHEAFVAAVKASKTIPHPVRRAT